MCSALWPSSASCDTYPSRPVRVIVPFGEGDYYKARPSIAIGRPGTAETAAIDLRLVFPTVAILSALMVGGCIAWAMRRLCLQLADRQMVFVLFQKRSCLRSETLEAIRRAAVG